MARVLVTGAGGFVGSHLIDLLEPDHPNIAAWQRPGTEPLVRGTRIKWRDIEMHDREAVARAIAESAPEQIYHLAGVAHVGESWDHTHETFAGNVLATHHLFDAVRRAALRPRILITSSAFVYAPVNRAITEHDLVRPEQPVRHQQARAGNVGDTRVGRRWDCDVDRAIVQPCRAETGAVVRSLRASPNRSPRSRPASGRRR